MKPQRNAETRLATGKRNFSLDPVDNRRLAMLCGELNRNIKRFEEHFDVRITNRGNLFSVSGGEGDVQAAERVIRRLYDDTGANTEFTAEHIHLAMVEASASADASSGDRASSARHGSEPATDDEYDDRGAEVSIRTRKMVVTGKNGRQRLYMRNIVTHSVNFGIGPAGTGKTWLAVACACEALMNSEVNRIILVRPAVEAGERLGFLPGDIGQKVDPYLRPLYDALYEMLGHEKVGRLMERNIIELAPLAYMRGRTLNESFVILDEAQNTTTEQMKMFLTRLGFNSRAVITGDVTQIDLPRGQLSGLKHAMTVLDGVDGISFTHFKPRDVVRHPLVQRIVEAYESHGPDSSHDQNSSDS